MYVTHYETISVNIAYEFMNIYSEKQFETVIRLNIEHFDLNHTSYVINTSH